ncbi:MAG: DUF2971 domain-containing protein [Candidatus Sulfotelmatobacter sp.]
MSLYKYVAPERLDVLRSLLIRFTQPNAQNDPFEFRPLVSRFRAPSAARLRLSAKWDEKFPEALSQRDPALKEFLKKFPACVASVRELGLAEADRQSDEAAQREIFQQLDSSVGILSLSEVPNSFLMWCRYAAGHNGFVFEFDDKNPWFWARTQEKDDIHELRRVNYVDLPSSTYLAELGAHEVLYCKRKVWECEKEWRIIRPFVESASRKGEDVCLFSVPPAALTGVIVGSYTADDSIDELARIVGDNPDFAHLRIGCADCDPCEQTVDIFWTVSVGQVRER